MCSGLVAEKVLKVSIKSGTYYISWVSHREWDSKHVIRRKTGRLIFRLTVTNSLWYYWKNETYPGKELHQ